MKPLFTKSSDDLPLTYDIDYDVFLKHRGNWLLWRSLGSYSEGGTWIPPISFTEAFELPKDMVDFFFEMDDIMAKKQRQLTKKTAEKGSRR